MAERFKRGNGPSVGSFRGFLVLVLVLLLVLDRASRFDYKNDEVDRVAAWQRCISISPDRRTLRGFFLLVLVLVIVIGSAPIEDEDEEEDEDDLVAAPSRCVKSGLTAGPAIAV